MSKRPGAGTPPTARRAPQTWVQARSWVAPLYIAVGVTVGVACQAESSVPADDPTQRTSVDRTLGVDAPGSPPAPLADTEESMEDAVSRVRAIFETNPQGRADETWERAQDLVRSAPLAPGARRTSYSEYRDMAAQATGGGLSPLDLHGSLDAVSGDGECWLVVYSGLLSGGVAACVDAASGDVLHVYATPEG